MNPSLIDIIHAEAVIAERDRKVSRTPRVECRAGTPGRRTLAIIAAIGLALAFPGAAGADHLGAKFSCCQEPPAPGEEAGL